MLDDPGAESVDGRAPTAGGLLTEVAWPLLRLDLQWLVVGSDRDAPGVSRLVLGGRRGARLECAGGAPMYVERLEPTGGTPQPYPLVLVHGAGQTGGSYLATPDGREGWAPYFARRGFVTYVVDLPGHGRAGQPADFASWSGLRYVEALEALLERTGPALVLTHSMGGRVGWKLAERAPERLAGLFAVAPARPPNLVP